MDVDGVIDGGGPSSAPPPGNSSSSSFSFFVCHHDYLTNSQLRLQLRDPKLQLHFLTELHVVESYLTATVKASAAATRSD